MRSLAREAVFKYIFSRLFNRDDEGLFDVLLKNQNLTEDDKVFARKLLNTATENESRYISEIQNRSIGFNLNRIFNADKICIIIGMTELEFFKDIPTAVVIDQAVNLAFKFSTEKSTDFVNGILASFAKDYRKD